MESTGNRTRTLEQVMHIVFLATATASIISVILISVFIFMTGIPTMAEIGLGEFLLGRNWFPRHTPAQFGIFPMIISSIYVTIGAIVLGVPLGLLTAIFLARFCPKNIYRLIKPAVELMAEYRPCAVFRDGNRPADSLNVQRARICHGFSMLAAIILLGIMILPTIIGLSEAAIAVVPRSVRRGGGTGRLA